jgi:hypothetical protein
VSQSRRRTLPSSLSDEFPRPAHTEKPPVRHTVANVEQLWSRAIAPTTTARKYDSFSKVIKRNEAERESVRQPGAPRLCARARWRLCNLSRLDHAPGFFESADLAAHRLLHWPCHKALQAIQVGLELEAHARP